MAKDVFAVQDQAGFVEQSYPVSTRFINRISGAFFSQQHRHLVTSAFQHRPGEPADIAKTKHSSAV